MYCIQYCIALYCTVLYCTVSYCTVLYYTVLYCNVLYCSVLYCTILYCTVLWLIVLLSFAIPPLLIHMHGPWECVTTELVLVFFIYNFWRIKKSLAHISGKLAMIEVGYGVWCFCVILPWTQDSWHVHRRLEKKTSVLIGTCVLYL